MIVCNEASFIFSPLTMGHTNFSLYDCSSVSLFVASAIPSPLNRQNVCVIMNVGMIIKSGLLTTLIVNH